MDFLKQKSQIFKVELALLLVVSMTYRNAGSSHSVNERLLEVNAGNSDSDFVQATQ